MSRLEELFGMNVFSDEVMLKRLPKDTLLCIMVDHRMTPEEEKEAAKAIYTAIMNFEG